MRSTHQETDVVRTCVLRNYFQNVLNIKCFVSCVARVRVYVYRLSRVRRVLRMQYMNPVMRSKTGRAAYTIILYYSIYTTYIILYIL